MAGETGGKEHRLRTLDTGPVSGTVKIILESLVSWQRNPVTERNSWISSQGRPVEARCRSPISKAALTTARSPSTR